MSTILFANFFKNKVNLILKIEVFVETSITRDESLQLDTLGAYIIITMKTNCTNLAKPDNPSIFYYLK